MWDLFISHAWEDKEKIARPLADVLSEYNLKVWYDDFTLRAGDSLMKSINKGLAQSRYGAVILSPAFFEKKWTQLELGGLIARETNNNKIILPIWHKIDFNDIIEYSPVLADKVALRTKDGLEKVAEGILRVVKGDTKIADGSSRKIIPTDVQYHQDGNRMKGFSEIKFKLNFFHKVRFEWQYSLPLGTSYVFLVDDVIHLRDNFGLLWQDKHYTLTIEGIECVFTLKSRFGDGTAGFSVADNKLW